MKTRYVLLIGAAILPLLAGCISTPMALAPVGPEAISRALPRTNGYLQVFSATRQSPQVASVDPVYFNLHTGYDIYDPAGKNVKFVPNHASNMDEWPDEVRLAPGKYNIVARSTCCGLVTVPVVIEPGKTTIVHLDRNWWPPSNTVTNQLVFLPDGEAVGWSTSITKSSE